MKQTEFYKSILVITLPPLKVGFLENGQDTGKRAPMTCAMIYWGNNQDRFYEVFIEYGAVCRYIQFNWGKGWCGRKKV